MKKIMFVAVLSMALGFTSCGSDDDGGSNSGCTTCSFDGETAELCEGENGTIIDEDGEDTGLSLEDFKALIALAGGSCN
ncbi:hypothetical protein GCM10022393_05960 [Aquimarina addita]|uniref:Uncharacterized protein n=1 Tax=Aquimarina addita TaxID=870485 RepID=A0ABP7XAT7_9FLAO